MRGGIDHKETAFDCCETAFDCGIDHEESAFDCGDDHKISAFDFDKTYTPHEILMSIDASPYVDHAAVRQILMQVFCRRISNEQAYHLMKRALRFDNIVLFSFEAYMEQYEE